MAFKLIKILIVGTYWRHSWKLFSVGKQFLLVWADNPMADLLAVIAESVEDHKLFAFSFSGTRGWWLWWNLRVAVRTANTGSVQ